MTDARKGRRMLVLIALVFAAPILIASLLAFSGWMPAGRRNYGELVDPPQRLEPAARMVAGSVFEWATPQWHWTLVVAIPERCDDPCRVRLDQVGNLRISLGRHAGKLRIATNRALPAPGVLSSAAGVYHLAQLPQALRDRLPPAQGDLTMALVDPGGYLMLRYPEHADLKQVRKDLGKLIR